MNSICRISPHVLVVASLAAFAPRAMAQTSMDMRNHGRWVIPPGQNFPFVLPDIALSVQLRDVNGNLLGSASLAVGNTTFQGWVTQPTLSLLDQAAQGVNLGQEAPEQWTGQDSKTGTETFKDQSANTVILHPANGPNGANASQGMLALEAAFTSAVGAFTTGMPGPAHVRPFMSYMFVDVLGNPSSLAVYADGSCTLTGAGTSSGGAAETGQLSVADFGSVLEVLEVSPSTIPETAVSSTDPSTIVTSTGPTTASTDPSTIAPGSTAPVGTAITLTDSTGAMTTLVSPPDDADSPVYRYVESVLKAQVAAIDPLMVP